MNRAFEEVFGVSGAFDGIQMAGRTDRWILDDAAARAGVDTASDSFDQFRLRYFATLRETLQEPRPGKGVLPGVRPLLQIMQSRADIACALLTGNCEEGARIKLQHFDLWEFFSCGAFGDDAADRNHLFDVALDRVRTNGGKAASSRDVLVVGDTVLDVACAQAAGARSVAVATGTTDADTLRRSGADVVLADLSDVDGFMKLIDVQI